MCNSETKSIPGSPGNYGVCTTTNQHPGTISITPATLRRLTYDLVRDAYDKGLRNFFLITGHGGARPCTGVGQRQVKRRLSEITKAVYCKGQK